MHHLRTPEEVKQALGPGGAMETFLKAKEEGKVKYLGFSAHTTKGALQAMEGFRFDTVMFPINFVELYLLGFGQEVLDLAEKQGAAVVAIKPMCRGAWPEGVERTRKWWYRPVEDLKEIDLALRFTLSQKAVVTGFPPAFVDLTDRAIEVGRNYHPTTPAEAEFLRQLAQSCESIFRREEEQVAHAMPCRQSPFPGCPYEHA
jgi:predicted aldo/keto reductase-like oxidoreductase